MRFHSHLKIGLWWLAAGIASLSMESSTAPLFRAPPGPGDYVETIKSGSRLRKFRLHVPSRYNPKNATPLLLAFHGTSASAAVLERETSFNPRADSMNFLVVYPEGLHRGWNIGECCRYSFMKNVDDVRFSLDVIRTLQRFMNVDSTRIYATGYSDGGSLAYLLACKHPRVIAAASAIGSTLYDPLPKCEGPVSILNIHATRDGHVPFLGKTGTVASSERGEHTEHSASDVVHFWLENNKCALESAAAKTENVKRDYYTCRGSEVVFFTIEGGDHGWPGGGRGWILSPMPPKDLSASDSILKFFFAHPRSAAH